MQPRHLCVLLARYHRWAYKRLYQTLDQLSDNDYRARRNMQYGSIHRTLNHLLLSDTLWYSRLTGGRFAIKQRDQEVEFDREKLFDRLVWQATTLAVFAKDCGEEALAGKLSYTDGDGKEQSMPLAGALLHVFNHATHHRSQIAAILAELGQASPDLDMVCFLQERQKKPAEENSNLALAAA
jgi:uncharacterized damage-inducible protein DinB